MFRRVAAPSIAGAVVSLVLGGCGGSGPLSGKALQQEATSLRSLAAEGSLLAGNAARGETTSPFLRVHGGYLHQAAASSQATLARAETVVGRRLATLAGRVSLDLGRLSHSGSDHAT